jgi:glutathione S-transferase
MQKPTLIYFALRGRGEYVRLVLAEAGVDHHEHPVVKETGLPPIDGRPQGFSELKATGELPFEALPVWVEPDGFKLAQTTAIVDYLGRTHDLHGTTPREQALVDQTLLAIDTDLRPEFRKLVLAAPDKRAAVREEYQTKFQPRWFGFLEKTIKGPFVLGERITVADLALFGFLETQRDNKLGDAFLKLPRLAALFEAVAARPNVAAWLKSPRRYPPLIIPT